MNQKAGSGSLRFKEAPFVLGSASVVGTKEGEGPLGELFDMVGADDRFGADSWEKAESSLQKEALTLALGKSKKNPEDMLSIRIPSVNEQMCIGCGACENLCPARPVAAIHVEGHLVHKDI